MARESTASTSAAKRPTRARAPVTRKSAPRRAAPRARAKKPGRLKTWFTSIPARIKSLVVKVFLGVSVLSATFPAVTEGVTSWAGQRIDAGQLQSILAIPILGDILRRTSLSTPGSGAAPSAKGSKPKAENSKAGRDLIRNPFS